MPLRLTVYFNSLITEIHRKNMSYKYLEHSTDAFIEVKAKTMEEAFLVAGKSVVETIIDSKNIQEIEEKDIEKAIKYERRSLVEKAELKVIIVTQEKLVWKNLLVFRGSKPPKCQ